MNRSPPKNKSPQKIRSQRSKYKPFYRDIASILTNYYDPRYKLLPWINKDLLPVPLLSENPKAIYFLKDVIQKYYPDGNIWNPDTHPYKQFSYTLARNPELIIILETYPQIWNYLDPEYLAENPSSDIRNILEKHLKVMDGSSGEVKRIRTIIDEHPINFDSNRELKSIEDYKRFYSDPKSAKILYQQYIKNRYIVDDLDDSPLFWRFLSTQPHAEKTIETEYKRDRNSNLLYWPNISANPGLINIIQEELKYPNNKINWQYLSLNPNALSILEKNKDKIDYDRLTQNTNPKAVAMVIKLYEKTNNPRLISMLSNNPSAIYFLEKYQTKVNYERLAENPGIFIEDKPDRYTIKFFEDLEL